MSIDTESMQSAPPPQTIPVVAGAGPVPAVVAGFTPEAREELRQHAASTSAGGNRLVWFLVGFCAAIASVAVAVAAFLVVSDSDDDGTVQLEVPAVEVDVDG